MFSVAPYRIAVTVPPRQLSCTFPNEQQERRKNSERGRTVGEPQRLPEHVRDVLLAGARHGAELADDEFLAFLLRHRDLGLPQVQVRLANGNTNIRQLSHLQKTLPPAHTTTTTAK